MKQCDFFRPALLIPHAQAALLWDYSLFEVRSPICTPDNCTATAEVGLMFPQLLILEAGACSSYFSVQTCALSY